MVKKKGLPIKRSSEKELFSCCVFRPSNGCFACHLLVEMVFFNVYHHLLSQTEKAKKVQKEKKLHTKHLGATLKCKKNDFYPGVNQHLKVIPKSW